MRNIWEYHTVFVPQANLDLGPNGRTSPLDEQLRNLGAEGWELITIIGHPRSGAEAGHLVVMKRPGER